VAAVAVRQEHLHQIELQFVSMYVEPALSYT
jgi:hypothetical protein